MDYVRTCKALEFLLGWSQATNPAKENPMLTLDTGYHMPSSDMLDATRATAQEMSDAEAIVSRHGHEDPCTLIYVCLDCHSIGAIADRSTRADRDRTALAFDFTCCGVENTLTFLSA
jgi:hypothetical protein